MFLDSDVKQLPYTSCSFPISSNPSSPLAIVQLSAVASLNTVYNLVCSIGIILIYPVRKNLSDLAILTTNRVTSPSCPRLGRLLDQGRHFVTIDAGNNRRNHQRHRNIPFRQLLDQLQSGPCRSRTRLHLTPHFLPQTVDGYGHPNQPKCCQFG